VGGEEFAVLAPGLAPDDAARVAERIRDAVNHGVTTFGGKAIGVTLSAGVATSNATAPCTAATLFLLADQALYAAKQAGRNRVSTAPLP
jgi:diguanylate cyclase (GGDEF)-like protein